MNDTEALIDKHRANGLLIDTNLMILMLVGRTNRRRIEHFKRTESYTIADYELLERFVKKFRRMVTTPHILTEVSNLAILPKEDGLRIRSLLKDSIEVIHELHEPSRVIAQNPHFRRLGLTDAAVSNLCRKTLVLTSDLDLWYALSIEGFDAINFNHFRRKP